MEEYRHGHGLFRGCSKQLRDVQLAVEETAFGVQFVLTKTTSRTSKLLWVDDAFLEWCRLPAQIARAEGAYGFAKKVGLLLSEWDEARFRPHLVSDAQRVDGVHPARFHCLSGPCRATDLGDPSALIGLPDGVLIERGDEHLRLYFPLVVEPDAPLSAILKLAGVQLA